MSLEVVSFSLSPKIVLSFSLVVAPGLGGDQEETGFASGVGYIFEEGCTIKLDGLPIKQQFLVFGGDDGDACELFPEISELSRSFCTVLVSS